MIIFDNNTKRAGVLKRLIKKQGHGVTISIYKDETKCTEALASTDIVDMLWIGIDAEYLIQWITSMEPSVRRIIIYHDLDIQAVLATLRKAKYTAEHIPYNLLHERLSS